MIRNMSGQVGRLRGKTLFLSASVPNHTREKRYRRIESAHIEIEEAVISLARAVLSEEGRLVFGGHPSISPLVAMVAAEYLTPRYAESEISLVEEGLAPIAIYQSRAFEGFLPDKTWQLYRLRYADIHWTEAVSGEKYDPTLGAGAVQCAKSLSLMRRTMLEQTRPDAMVCAGGMEGVEEEMKLFREMMSGRPIYVLETTGGAAALIAHGMRELGQARGLPHEPIRVFDRELLMRLEPLRAELPKARQPELMQERPYEGIPEEEKEFRYTPYPLIMQMIVRDLSG